VHRAIEIRIYPDREQVDFLDRRFGAVRFVGKKGLAIKQHRYKVHGDKRSATDDLQPLLAAAKRNPRLVLHDRDVNAAFNIKHLGILQLRAADRRKPLRPPGKFE
jgi:transposase